MDAPPVQVCVGALRRAILARSSDGLGLLKESLGSSDYTLFSSAVRTALEIPGPEVTRILTASLPQLRTDNQIVVMQALGTRGDEEVIPALAAIAKKEEHSGASDRRPSRRSARKVCLGTRYG